MLPGWIGAAVALLLLAVFAYTQFRHIGLALVAVLAPLLGYAVAITLHIPQQPLAYLGGFFAALVFSSEVALRICDGTSAADATKQTPKMLFVILFWPIALMVCAAAMLPLAARDFVSLTLSLSVVLCGASALIVLPLTLRILPYSEEFIARSNRLRENRERWLDRLTFAIQPRWGLSVSGIALIFAILGFFGGENSSASRHFMSPAALAILGVLFAAFAYVATRNMRQAIAFFLSAAVMVCLMFWVDAHMAVSAAPLTLALASAPALLLAGHSSAFMRAGDTIAVAMLRSSEQFAVPISFYCFAAALTLCSSGAMAAAILIPCGGVAALIFFPALATAIYGLFPLRVSLDAYRVR